MYASPRKLARPLFVNSGAQESEARDQGSQGRVAGRQTGVQAFYEECEGKLHCGQGQYPQRLERKQGTKSAPVGREGEGVREGGGEERGGGASALKPWCDFC